jgi:hypothetical protein
VTGIAIAVNKIINNIFDIIIAFAFVPGYFLLADSREYARPF